MYKKDDFFLDFFNIIILLLGVISAVWTYFIITDPSKKIESFLMLSLTIVTISSSILDTIINTFKAVNKFRKTKDKTEISTATIKITTTLFGFLVLTIVVILILFKPTVWNSFKDFSSRGGFTTITSTLLMFKIIESRISLHDSQKEEQYNFTSTQLDKEIETKKKYLETLDEIETLKKNK